MNPEAYRYTFGNDVQTEDIQAALLLAVWSCEALHGEAQVRLDAIHCLNNEKQACVVDASTPVGRDLNRLFIGFINREFGPDSFTVERISEHDHPHQEVAA